MLNPQKKVSRKEIKEDKLVTSYFEARAWAEENRKLLSYVALAIVVLVAGVFIYLNRQSEDNQKATTELAKVFPLYDQGKYDQAINGVPQEGTHGLQFIVDEYGSTHSGNIASLYLADSYFALGQYEKALGYYKKVSVDDRMVSASALAGVGACYESMKQFADAASYYERAASKNMVAGLAPNYLRRAAESFAAAGDKAKAVEILKTLKKEFPSTQEARDADLFIAQFGA